MDPRDLWGRVRERWQAFSTAKKVSVVLGCVGLVATLIYFSALLSQLNYGSLFTGLTPADAGAIIEKLEEMGVSYRLTEGGSTILVP